MKLKPLAFLFAAALVLGSATAVRAHGGHDHVMGTVKSVELKAGKLEVETRDGKRVAIQLTDKTRYLRSDAAVESSELVVGLRVVVDAGKDADTLVAREVRLGPAKAAPSPR